MKKIITFLVVSGSLYTPAHGYYIDASDLHNNHVMEIIEQAAIQRRVEFCRFESEPEQIISANGKVYVLYHTSGMVHDGICDGGSGTGLMHIAQLQGYRVLNVDLLQQFAERFNTKRITEIQVSQNDILSFKNHEYGERDGNNFPSIVYLNQIRLSDMRLIYRQKLGRVSYF